MLVEVDALEVQVIVDNEADPMSTYTNAGVEVSGRMADVAMGSAIATDRGEAREMRMEDICCGAHGLSLLVTATKGGVKHSMLFDTAPTERAWEQNVRSLAADIAKIELIQLSHWHRDHSGGMLQAIRMIEEAKAEKGISRELVVDLHPARPDYRGFMVPTGPVSMEADPTFEEIEGLGAKISKHAETHTVLDDMFLVSGEIPRVTPYEVGLRRGIRFDKSKGVWGSDEMIADERFLMCNVKGTMSTMIEVQILIVR